eukprot:6172710-Pleurochrysis_carterae.AAC.2
MGRPRSQCKNADYQAKRAAMSAALAQTRAKLVGLERSTRSILSTPEASALQAEVGSLKEDLSVMSTSRASALRKLTNVRGHFDSLRVERSEFQKLDEAAQCKAARDERKEVSALEVSLAEALAKLEAERDNCAE